MIMLPLHQAVLFNCVPPYEKEPCSSRLQRDALPNMLKSTFVTRLRVELRTSHSECDMLAVTPPGNQCSMSDSNTLLRFGRPAHRHQCICCPYSSYDPDSYQERQSPYLQDIPLHQQALCGQQGNQTLLKNIASVFRQSGTWPPIFVYETPIQIGVSSSFQAEYPTPECFRESASMFFQRTSFEKLPRCTSRGKLYSSFCI